MNSVLPPASKGKSHTSPYGADVSSRFIEVYLTGFKRCWWMHFQSCLQMLVFTILMPCQSCHRLNPVFEERQWIPVAPYKPGGLVAWILIPALFFVFKCWAV